MGLAMQLSYYQQVYGDWRELFNEMDRIQRVTAEDVQRVAREVFRATNRTVGLNVPVEES
jgi:predicted Zn-dependent peptidase